MKKEQFKDIIKEAVREVLQENFNSLIETVIKSSIKPVIESFSYEPKQVQTQKRQPAFEPKPGTTSSVLKQALSEDRKSIMNEIMSTAETNEKPVPKDFHNIILSEPAVKPADTTRKAPGPGDALLTSEMLARALAVSKRVNEG